MIRFKSLGSGSSGNATVIQARCGTQMVHLLVDCGLGIRELDKRLGAAGMLADQIDAIFVTHEHGDHIGCAHRLAVRERIPVYMSAGTYDGVGRPDFDGLLRLACDGEDITIGSLRVRPFTVPHDAREPLQLTCTDGAVTLGVLTDLGHATPHVLARLMGLNALLLEFNHDSDLLAGSAYPPFLKQRVGGNYGHLSNSAAAAIARAVHHGGLRHLLAAHLSEQNNRPEIVRDAMAAALGASAHEMLTATAAEGSPWLDL